VALERIQGLHDFAGRYNVPLSDHHGSAHGGLAMNREALELLLTRRSVLANNLGPPGPDGEALAVILKAAARVPDHKKLIPWRFIVFAGAARTRFGKLLAAIAHLEEAEPMTAGRLETEARRFERAPVIVGVVSKAAARPGVPEWEQILSAGAACQNLVLAANASGFASQWITEWYAYSPGVHAALGLGASERMAGFIYIGTPTEAPTERDRPDLGTIVEHWRPGPPANGDPAGRSET